MLRSALPLTEYVIEATDGALGRIKDLLFDDRAWVVRYFVADSSKWLPGRLVLIPPTAVDEPDWSRAALPVAMTREQVKRSPDIAEDEPVSRQREMELHRFFGWAPYWMGADPGYAGTLAAPVPPGPEKDPAKVDDRSGDPHLRSLREVTGYHISARDGEIGHLEDLVLDDETWAVRYAVVDTRNWWPGRKVIVSPQWLQRVSWKNRQVVVDLKREQIREAPEFDPSAPINREYEARLYDYYGRPRYWS